MSASICTNRSFPTSFLHKIYLSYQPSDMCQFLSKHALIDQKSLNTVGGTHAYLSEALNGDDYTTFVHMMTSLVHACMQLPEDTDVRWFLEGERAPWILDYTNEGSWHTDIFSNTRLEDRTWSLCVVLHSCNSVFQIENNTIQTTLKNSVIIFPSHLRHRGCVTKGGSRRVLAAEFRLDREVQQFVTQRNPQTLFKSL